MQLTCRVRRLDYLTNMFGLSGGEAQALLER